MTNINLGPIFEEYLQQKVATGYYTRISEVVREARRCLTARDEEGAARRARVQQAIQEGPDPYQRNLTEGEWLW